MDLQQILAALLNPNGTQQAQPIGMATPVGDHAGAVQQRLGMQPPQMQPQLPPQMAQQAPQQQAMPPQAPQGQPMPQPAPQAPQPPQGGGLGGAIGGILQNIIAPQSAQKNKTVGWLTTQGMDPGFATVLASDKTALRSYILQKSKGGGLTEFDQRAQAAQQYGLDPSTPEGRNFVLSGKLPEARGGTAELGLQPQYGTDDQGNPVLIQIGKDGKAVRTQMPDGVSLSKQPIKVDLGTSWGLIDPITRQMIGNVPKDLAGAAAQTEMGKARAGAAFDLPRIEQNAQQTLDVIEKLKKHPGRETATGMSGWLDPRNYAAGTNAADFKVALDQAKGQTFLQAYNALKGGGSITDIEGEKATAAIARLNTSQSDEEFAKALDDFESVIKSGLERVKQQAGLPSDGGYTPGAPAAVTPGGQRVIQQMTNPQPMGSGDGWQNLGNGVPRPKGQLMATFQFQTPNGTYEVDAPDQATAFKALQGMSQQSAVADAGVRAKSGIDRAKAIMASGGPNADAVANVPAFSPQDYGQAGSAAMGAADSTTFGWGDELASVLGSALSGVPRKQVLSEMRANAGKAQSENPGSYIAGQVGGGLAQGIATGGGGFAMNAAQTGGTLGRVALGSALDGILYGGAYGAGSADGGIKDRIKGGAIGAGAGGLAGAAIPYVVAGVNAVAKPLLSPIMARLNPQQYSDAALAEALSRSGKTPDEIAQILASAQRDNQGMFTLADAMGNSGQRMLSTASRNPHEGRQALVEALQQRQMGQGERLSNALAEGFNAPDTAAQRAASLTADRSALAAVNYPNAAAGAGPVDVSGAISAADDVLTPGVNRIANPGSNIADDSLEGAIRRARALLTDGSSQLSDFGSVLRAKQDIADQIATAQRSGKNNQVRLLSQINSRLDSALEAASPGYRQANDAFRAQSRTIDAVDLGKAATSGRARAADNIAAFGAMPAGEQNAFRAGYADPMIAKVESSSLSPTTNRARPLITEKTGQEFPAFAVPQRADQMGRRIAREQRMFETASQALGGSKTADNLADAADLNKFDPSIMTNLMQGRPVAAVISAVTKALNESRGLPPSVLTKLSQSLMETDPAAARLLLQAGTSRNLSTASRKALYSTVLSRLATTTAVPALTRN